MQLSQVKPGLKQYIKKTLYGSLEGLQLEPPLPLPAGYDEGRLREFVGSVRVSDAPEEAMRNYCNEDFRRFVYTWGLVADLEGPCLELGGNPYFTTMLLREFTRLELALGNYFGHPGDEGSHLVRYTDRHSGEPCEIELGYRQFNLEEDPFPYPDESFQAVIFAEIIEHLLSDPCRALREIHRVLKPGGTLVLTTPNVARLENIARLLGGANMYDPYSGHGPYGRHNREYTVDELRRLLQHEGFQIDACFTADVHLNRAGEYADLRQLTRQVRGREGDLGQYIFIKARRNGAATHEGKLPGWLYRSYPPEKLD